MSHHGFQVMALAMISDHATIRYNVCGDEADFSFGNDYPFQLVATKTGLEKLVSKATEALQEIRDSRNATE